MIATGLKRQCIETADDESLVQSIIYGAAESVLFEDDAYYTDIQACVTSIKEWIRETKLNYPSYFTAGECE